MSLVRVIPDKSTYGARLLIESTWQGFSGKERAMYSDPQRLEDITSIRDAMRQIAQEADAVVELLDVRIEDEHLDGRTEAEDVRTVLELIQNLSLEVSEELDAYQQRHAT
jgi:hypothetical protein